MLSISDLKKYDPKGMYAVYDRWPTIAKDAYQSNLESIEFKNIDHIVFAGMGGSGAIGDLFSSILSKSNIHVSLVKGYLLPNTVTKNTLVVVTSISGNTIETVRVLEAAKKLNSNLIAFSSGGKIENYCKKNKINYRKIDFTHSPRVSFVNFVYSILNVLNSTIPIKKNEILESINELETTRNQISSDNILKSNPALNLASWISSIPLIYYPHGLQSSAIRFKSSLQENAKIHVIIEDVLEACHNGIVAWERSSNVQPILLRGYDDLKETKARFEIIKEYFLENNIDFNEVCSVRGNILTKLINLIYFFDYTSIYRAVSLKTNPSPVNSIDFIKNRLSSY